MNVIKKGACLLLASFTLTVFAAGAQAPDLTKMDIVLSSIPDGPVALVGEETISADEFRDLYVSEVARHRYMKGEPLTDVERLEIGMQSLRMLIERSILYQEARKRGISVPQEEVEAGWRREAARLGERLGDNGSLSEEEVLELAGATKEEALQELRRTLVIERMRERIREDRGIAVSDVEVSRAYDEMKDSLVQKERVYIHQILLRAPEGAPNREAKQKAAQNALARLRAGESFSSVAQEVSEGPSKEQGGDPGGPVPLDGLPPEMRAAVAALEPGDMSGVIETKYGFHIIRLIEVLPGKKPSLEEMEPVIRQRLMNRRDTEAIRVFCAQATKGADYIQIFLDLDKQLRGREDLREVFEYVEREAAEQPEPMG
jgi:parvulin-like peptidyl-prolyl isomerase